MGCGSGGRQGAQSVARRAQAAHAGAGVRYDGAARYATSRASQKSVLTVTKKAPLNCITQLWKGVVFVLMPGPPLMDDLDPLFVFRETSGNCLDTSQWVPDML